MNLFPTVFLLGAAGIDPMGAVVVISALSIGISKNEIIKFALTTFIGTVITGLLFSKVLGSGINWFSDMLNKIPDNIFVIFNFLLAILLLRWFAEIILRKDKTNLKEEKKESFFIKYIKKGLFTVGILFAISALTDPSFLTLITISGQSKNIVEIILCNCIWVFISQFPLFFLTFAVILNKHEKAIYYFKNKILGNEKLKKNGYILLAAVIFIAGIVILANAIVFLTNGYWLF